MFSEWSDPYDIDEYYDDMYHTFKDVIPKKQSFSSPVQMPVNPPVQSQEKPIGQLVYGPEPFDSNHQTKSRFEVTPNTIFSDGHPVGSQPSYNILRSGPPSTNNEKEQFIIHQQPRYLGMDCDSLSWTHIIIFMAFLFLICVIAQMRAQLNNATMTMKMLMIMCSHEKFAKKEFQS